MIVMEESLKKIKQQLHEAGFKLTPQREVTVKILLENEKDHLSAEEIYMQVKNQHAEIGLATVYRTLEILTDLQIVNKISFQDGLARYDLNRDGARHFHHHLLCIQCGNIEEVHEDMLDEIEKEVEKKFNFFVKDHRLTFHGICSDCQEKAKKS
ncbi:Fur family transcriptional regulator [Lacticigenium naphthae]|uniref:ferric iron uptake transcriptional regulator n=1 Tax=Lacticigenium naphthae TaxID=515351 RepID=UPI00041A83F7|nr:Fur family transcriptional regulator [Lacticigenium naphthae]